MGKKKIDGGVPCDDEERELMESVEREEWRPFFCSD